MKYWVWVFGEVEGLRWVLRNRRMAFPESAAARAASMSSGDHAILYLSTGAFHNPTRDPSRLGGIVGVAGRPSRGRAVTIAGREFRLFVGIEPGVVLPERQGPEVKPLAARLERVKRPEVWGQYFRTSPVEVSASDYAVLAAAVQEWASTRGR